MLAGLTLRELNRNQFLATLEEVMEMSGIAIFLYALTSYLAPFHSPFLRIEHDQRPDHAPWYSQRVVQVS